MNQIFFILMLVLLSPLSADWRVELKNKIAQANHPLWMLDQIQADLAPFKEVGISEKNILTTIEEHPMLGFIICRIHESQFSWSCTPSSESQDQRVKMFTESIDKLSQTIRLPNVTFLVFIGEAFCEKGHVPVFSWCKHENWSPTTVAIPDYEALSGNYHFLNQMHEGNNRYPWHAKENIACWRGAAVGGWGFNYMPRLKLVQISEKYPQFIDAKFSGVFPIDDVEERNLFLRYLDKFISVSDQIRCKYQILVDGHVSAFSRAYWQLFSNCVMFKHNSPWYQWFYRALRPYEHYVPFYADASDLVQKIQWAREHDAEMRTISQQANDFATNNLTHADNMLYVYLLLNEYAKLQKF